MNEGIIFKIYRELHALFDQTSLITVFILYKNFIFHVAKKNYLVCCKLKLYIPAEYVAFHKAIIYERVLETEVAVWVLLLSKKNFTNKANSKFCKMHKVFKLLGKSFLKRAIMHHRLSWNVFMINTHNASAV